MKMKLTERELKRLSRRDRPYDIADTHREAPPAFGCRVMPSGEITFHLYRRFPGSPSPVRRALGRNGELDLDSAREKARAWIAMLKQGIDPCAEAKRVVKAALEAERVHNENTVQRALDAYLGCKNHLRTIRAKARELQRELKPWFDRPLADIDKAAVCSLIADIKARGTNPQATYALMKSFFIWCVKTDRINASPCAKIDVEELVGPKLEESSRALNDIEIRAYWRAAGSLPHPLAPYFKLLLLTGLRRLEASNANWQEIDLDTKRFIVPASRMKGRTGKARPHLVPVTAEIERLLKDLPHDSAFLFPGRNRNGAKPFSTFSAAKAALDAAMKEELAKEGCAFEPFVIHDVRRSVRTRLSSLGIPEHIAERLLAHAQPELDRRYNLYSYEREKAAALQSWHASLKTIIDPRPDLRIVA